MPYSERTMTLTSKLLAVDRLSTSSIAPSEVTTLKHEGWDDAMEPRASISIAVLTSAQLAEVPRSPRYNVIIEFEDDAPSWGVVDGDVEL